VPAPTGEDVHAVLHKIVGSILKMLTRRGALVDEQGSIARCGLCRQPRGCTA